MRDTEPAAGLNATTAIPIHYVELETVFAATVGANIHSLAVVGATRDAGVTTIAYALARRAAAAGKRTLLVDFNAVCPAVGSNLGLPEIDWTPDDEQLSRKPIALGDTGMYALPAPSCSASALAFRDRGPLSDCFKKWRSEFDVVVADTSPLLQHNQNNIPPENIAASCDGCILAVLAGRTADAQVIDSCARLRSAGAKIVGAVLNDQFNPPLSEELIRETHRLDSLFPSLMNGLRNLISSNAFLNQDI